MNLNSEVFIQLLDLLSSGVGDQAICLTDSSGIIRSWNKGASNFYQYSAEESAGLHVSELLNGLNPTTYLDQAFADGHVSFEHDVKRRDGSIFPAYLTFQSIYETGELQGFALMARSLAYTKKIAHNFSNTIKHIEQPSLFQQLIEYSYSGITLFDANLNFIYRSPSAARITGFNDQGRTDLTFNDIVHPGDQVRIKTMLDNLLQHPGESVTCRLKTRHYLGHFIDLEGIFTNWLDEPKIRALVLNFHDITERQHTEDTLKQTIEELSAYKYALDVAAIVAITDQKGIIRHANKNFSKISGYSEKELIGKDHRLLNSGYHDKSFIKEMWRTIAGGKVWKGDFCNRRKDGSHYWVDTTIIPFLNQHGKPYQYVSIRFDRTEAKQAKQELIEKNIQIGNLLESINDGFIALDQELRYTYVNQRTSEMVGLSPAAMSGKKIWDLFPEAIGSSTWSAIEEARRTGVPVTNEDYYAPLNLWQENHIYPNEKGLSIFISDISWRKREEEQKALLADISKIFEQSSALTELMQQVMQKIITVNNSICLAETWLVERNGQQIILSAQKAKDELTSGFFKERPDFNQLERGEGLPGRTWARGKIEFWTDLKNHPDFLRQEAAANACLSSAFGVPLRHNSQLVGVLLLGQIRAERPAHLSDVLLARLGDHLGSAISRRQLENDLHDIFEAAPDIICIVGTDRYFKKVNPAMCTLLGYSESELLGLKVDALVHPEDLADSQERMGKFITGELSSLYFENRYRARNGSIVELAWTAAKGNEKDILFCVAKNISDKKSLEQLLHKASELARIGSWEINLETGEIFWSDITADIMEVPPDFRPFRNTISSLFKPADWEKMDSALVAASEGGPAFDLEFEISSGKHQHRWVRILGEGEFDAKKCIRIYGSVQDIDARKRA
ncbi:PAS domain S-box protein [Pedobacter sp. JY14-1]|uniref:PAS domain S-box protein n=1 Tax=Pedobacter sp. JY14-1 TaxID=3034151 RepID=UPI0023E23252|nr:PAS domain S-box protein [Pedobacter sp. JY14-1]